jgi:hypothetical protein
MFPLNPDRKVEEFLTRARGKMYISHVFLRDVALFPATALAGGNDWLGRQVGRPSNGWQRQFEDPSELPTLRDAANYITALPKQEAELPEWHAAIKALLLVSDGGPTMLARIGVMQDLNRNLGLGVQDAGKEDPLGQAQTQAGPLNLDDTTQIIAAILASEKVEFHKSAHGCSLLTYIRGIARLEVIPIK